MNCSYNNHSHLASALAAALFAATCPSTLLAQHTSTEEANPNFVTNDWQELLITVVGEAVQAGVKSATKEILTTVGTSLLEAYVPWLGGLLGGGDPMEGFTQEIIDEIQRSHADIAERHRVLLDEIQQQYQSDVIGSLRSSALIYGTWLASQDALYRAESREQLSIVVDDLVDVREDIEDYLKSPSSSSRVLVRRLALLEIHTLATQLSIEANEHYHSNVAIMTAFHRSPYSEFDDWVDSLNDVDIQEIELSSAPSRNEFRTITLAEVQQFYSQISSADAPSEFLDDVMTPIVRKDFMLDESQRPYWDTDVVSDPANWSYESPGELVIVITDLLEHYYYVDISSQDCVEERPWEFLEINEDGPWSEDAIRPAFSECGRSWAQTVLGEGYTGSFDEHRTLFSNLDDLHEVHRKMVYGDMLRSIYAASSVILDQVFERFGTAPRPRNRWDYALTQHDEELAVLAATPVYDDSLRARDVLTYFAAEAGAFDVDLYFEFLQLIAEDFAQAELAAYIAAVTSPANWMSDGQPGTAAAMRAFLGTGSILRRLDAGVSSTTVASQEQARLRADATARFIAVM